VTLPLGYRNNNPGNLRYRKEWNWPGVTGIDSKQFAIFGSPEDGIAQWIRQMRRYAKRGLFSLGEIVPVYAPATENNVAAYIASVVKQTGIPADRPLRWDDKDETIKLARAFIRHELGLPPPDWPGREWYDRAVYVRAWDKSKPLTKSRTITGAAGAAMSTAAVVVDAVVEVASQHTEVIVGAGEAAKSLWPRYGTIIAGLVALCFIAYVVYARWTRTAPEAPEVPFDQPNQENLNGNDQ
jgi:hypothetical protein